MSTELKVRAKSTLKVGTGRMAVDVTFTSGTPIISVLQTLLPMAINSSGYDKVQALLESLKPSEGSDAHVDG